jgi:DNA-binding transcriptional regulator YiaG
MSGRGLTESTGSNATPLSYAAASTGGQTIVGGLVATYACAALLALGIGQKTGGTVVGVGEMATPTGEASALVLDRRTSAFSDTLIAIDRHASETTVRQILVLRHRFSLTMQHLADIVGVTRPVVYRWQSGTVVPRRKHQERLAALVRFAEHFVATGGNVVGFALHVPLGGEVSLLSLLQRDELPEAAVKSVLSAIAQAGGGRRGFAPIGEDLRRHGIVPGVGDRGLADREDARISRRDDRSRRV